MSSIYIDCIQCGSIFELSDSERKRLKEKGFDLPLRCSDCRRHKERGGVKSRKHPNSKRDYKLKYGEELTELY